MTPSAPVRRFVALLGAWMLAGCVDVVSTVDPVPCWQPGGDFDFRPVTVEGVLQVDFGGQRPVHPDAGRP